MSHITIEPLSLQTRRTVFPVLREVAPGITLSGWLRMSRRLLACGASCRQGVLVARRDGSARPCGAVHYRRGRSLGDEPELVAAYFIAIDPIEPDRILQALLDAVERQAAETGCVYIHAVLNHRTGPAPEDFIRQGHAPCALLLQKPVSGHTRSA